MSSISMHLKVPSATGGVFSKFQKHEVIMGMQLHSPLTVNLLSLLLLEVSRVRQASDCLVLKLMGFRNLFRNQLLMLFWRLHVSRISE